MPVRLRLRWPWHVLPEAKSLVERLAAPLDDALYVLVHESAIGIVIVDQHGRIVRVNPALRAMADRAYDLSPGDPAVDIFSEPQRAEVWEELRPMLRGSRPARAFVSTLRGKGNRLEHTVKVTAVVLREPDASVSGAVLQFTDLSAQRRLEAQLAHSQKLQSVGQLAAGIAHDFNNLLTAMLGAAEEALDRGPNGAETTADLQQIRTSAERGAALVRQLLAFGRQQTLQPRVMAINDAVLGLVDLLRRLLGSAVKLTLALDSPDCLVCVDPTQLDQVLVNLAVNARDAMPDGGELALQTGHITLYRALTRGQETIPPGRYVMVEVHDTGVGIPDDVLPRIFDPFFTTRRERGGSGLGLSTVHGIVRQSGGYLAVDSMVGQGTSFRIYLPRHSEPAVAIPAQPTGLPAGLVLPSIPTLSRPIAASSGAGRLVLVVDDEAAVLRLAVRALTRGGWQVLAADTAEAALALLAEPEQMAGLSAVVSDVVMPGMDGVELVREIRRHRPGLPAILASGYAEGAVHGDLAEQDILYLPKPYTLKAMVAAVDNRALPAALPVAP